MRFFTAMKLVGYHPKWKKISFFIRYYRAKNKCERCSAENYKPHPITGSNVVLTVSHTDNDKTNNSFFNLKALCQKCHNTHDVPYRKENRRKTMLAKTKQQQLFL